MKKMLFSAIALVAFTATSMAEEKVKETKKNQEENKEKIRLIFDRDCINEKRITYLAALGDEFSSSEASGMSYHIYFWCMSTQFNSIQ